MVVFKKPPDKYKSFKIPLEKIINNPLNFKKIEDVVIRTNKLVIHVYQFLRLWLLDK
jgi:hypothetical protein